MPRYNIGPTRDYTTLYRLTSASWLYPISAWGEPVEIVLDPGVHVIQNNVNVGDMSCGGDSYVVLKPLDSYEYRSFLNRPVTLSANNLIGLFDIFPFCSIKNLFIFVKTNQSGTVISTRSTTSKVINSHIKIEHINLAVPTGVSTSNYGGSIYNTIVESSLGRNHFVMAGSNLSNNQTRYFNCIALSSLVPLTIPFFVHNSVGTIRSFEPLIVNCAAVYNQEIVGGTYSFFQNTTQYHISSTNNSTSDTSFIPNWNGSNGLSGLAMDDLGWSNFDDLHITSASPWYNAGFNLSAYFIKDIDNEIIQTWCIGVDDPESTNPTIRFSVDKTHIPLDTGVRFQDESNLYPYFTSSTNHERIWEIMNERTSATYRVSTNESHFDYLFTSGAIGGIQGDTIRVSLSAVYEYDGEVNSLDWI